MPVVFNINNNQINGVDKAPEWVQKGLDNIAIKFAEEFGKRLVQPNGNRNEALTTSQIRNIYGEILRLKMKKVDRTSLLLIKPRMAYMTKRKGTIGSKEFHEVMEKALDEVLNSSNEDELNERFQNFANFFEAILAYHRSFGGK